MQLPHPRSVLLTACLVSLGIATPAQSTINWIGGAQDITGPSNVSTNGLLCIALNCGPEAAPVVINGVHFQADRTHWAKKYLVVGNPAGAGSSQYQFGPQLCGGFSLDLGLDRCHNQSFGNTGDPMMDLAMEWNHHSRGSSTAPYKCVVNGLVSGHTYEIQIFASYGPNTTGKLAEWDDGMGGREGAGGVFLDLSKGQFITGIFVASGTSQDFTCYQRTTPDTTVKPPLKVTQAIVSMVQVRDLKPDVTLAYAQTYGLGTAGTMRGGNARSYAYPRASLGGSDYAPFIRLEGAPVGGTTVNFTAENSVGAATPAALFVGLLAADLPFIGGRLLNFGGLSVLYFTMPFNAVGSNHTRDHEFVIPLAIPQANGLDVFLQVLQVDANAPLGVSFSAGMKLHIGN